MVDENESDSKREKAGQGIHIHERERLCTSTLRHSVCAGRGGNERRKTQSRPVSDKSQDPPSQSKGEGDVSRPTYNLRNVTNVTAMGHTGNLCCMAPRSQSSGSVLSGGQVEIGYSKASARRYPILYWVAESVS